MDKRSDVLEVECSERDGTHIRIVAPAYLTAEKLGFYWKQLSQFPTLFNRTISGFEDFVQTFISISPNGEIKANGLIWEVDDIGIVWITDIYPNYQATGHFTFWDRKFRGREPIFRKLARFLFNEFGFHRITVEIPLHSQRVCDFVEKVGFTKEGRLRKAAWYKGEWWDVNLYSILEEEARWDSPKE